MDNIQKDVTVSLSINNDVSDEEIAKKLTTLFNKVPEFKVKTVQRKDYDVTNIDPIAPPPWGGRLWGLG